MKHDKNPATVELIEETLNESRATTFDFDIPKNARIGYFSTLSGSNAIEQDSFPMKNFWKAIRESVHVAPAIVLATICSFGIAVLWGSNIGALYPVIEITLRNESIQSWLENKVKRTEARLEAVEAKLRELDADEAAQAIPREQSDLTTANKQGTVSQPEPAQAVALDFSLPTKRSELESLRKDLPKEIESTLSQLKWANYILPTDAFHTICFIMGILVVSTLVKHMLMLTSDMLLGFASTTIVKKLRQRVFDKALQMDKDTYQRYGTSGLLSSITLAADGLSAGLMALFGALIREPLRIISCLTLACYISWRLLVLSIVLAPFMMFTIWYFNRKIRSIALSVLGRNAGFHEVMLEALSNIFTVQAFTMEEDEKKRFAGSTKDMQKVAMKMTFYSGLSKPFTELIGVGMVAITVCAGAYLVVNQETHLFFFKIRETPMSITDLLIFFGLLVGASDPMRKLSGVSIIIYNGASAANLLYGILESESKVSEPAQPITLEGRGHDLSIENLRFHYHASHPVLQNISLNIPYGRTIAILGHNGSGKSTLIQLLCRFYDPVDGSISLGGVDLRSLSLTDLRRRITLVSQNTELFNRSVFENIRYGSTDATREDVERAARQAHAHEFIINSLPQGFDTVVGQGGQKLSGGQRQRIALARAILRKPEVLILDESTSQIDMSSEIQIRETLQSMKGQMTIVIITHREALTAIADDVYTMQHGQLIHQSSLSKVA